MNYQEAKLLKQLLGDKVSEASKKLNAIPGIGSGKMGLTPDNVKKRKDYINAKNDFNTAFHNLRVFNRGFVKVFKKEISQERSEKRANINN